MKQNRKNKNVVRQKILLKWPLNKQQSIWWCGASVGVYAQMIIGGSLATQESAVFKVSCVELCEEKLKMETTWILNWWQFYERAHAPILIYNENT